MDTERKRKTICGELDAIGRLDKRALTREAVDCHLRATDWRRRFDHKAEKGACRLCRLNDLLEEYENLLFDMKENERKRGNAAVQVEEEREGNDAKTVTLFGEQRRGNWKPSKVSTVVNGHI